MGSAARFYCPSDVAVDSVSNVYVSDYFNETIRKVTPEGEVTTLAGRPGRKGADDGTGSAARFHSPTGLAVDGAGNLYVADSNNNTIRKVTPAGVVTTLAGSPGHEGSADGTGSGARFYGPSGVAIDGEGNLYVVDTGNNTIRKVTSTGLVTTLAGLPGEVHDLKDGRADGVGSNARFFHPAGVALDKQGNIYVADNANGTIRKGHQ